MKFDPDMHHRNSIRLQGYIYSLPGLYFITICTENRHCVFGYIQNDYMVLNDAGNMIACQWNQLNNRFPAIALHDYIVMPNHFHGIIELVGAIPCGCPRKTQNHRADTRSAPTIGDVVSAFKSLSTNQYIQNVKQNNWQPFAGKLWQRNYYEHIIRNEESYLKIAEYIQTNPIK